MTLPIKLISTDFDGTLHTECEDPPVPLELQKLIADLQAQGAKWVINTGRDFDSLMERLSHANLQIRPDFLVVVEREIHINDQNKFVGFHQWNNECSEAHEEIFTRVRADMPRIRDWIQKRFSATVYEDPYSPFCLVAESNQDADAILDYLGDYCRRVPKLTIVRNDIYARFSHEAYNKGTALREIARQLGISSDEVFAAGDHYNDLPMLSTEFARWLVAPHNAIPLVKEKVQRQNGFISSFSFGHGVAAGLKNCLGIPVI